MSLPDPTPPSRETVNSLRDLFSRDGFYAIENQTNIGNVHRIRYVEGGAVREVDDGRFEWVEAHFTDYDGTPWKGLRVQFLDGFS